MKPLNESDLEQLTLSELHTKGWRIAFGPDIAPDGTRPERESYGDVVLKGRLREAIERINPNIPEEGIEEALRKVLNPEAPSLIENNRRFHQMLTDGVDVSWMGPEGVRHDKVWLVDREDPTNNDWLAVNQFSVIENKRHRRPDIVLFLNGLPVGVIELKNPTDEGATLRRAYNQLQTYKKEIPSLFVYNEVLAISDGSQARVGTLTSGWDRFMPWRTITGDDLYREPGNEKQQSGELRLGLSVLIEGLLAPQVFLDYLLDYITFEDTGGGSANIAKKAAAYHQYHAVRKAVNRTLEAVSEGGDRRIGVVWHTQGSGKSLSMVFYTGKLIRHPKMANPTIVVLTDRNDLDDQLFGTFSANRQLLRQEPVQAESRQHLRELLRTTAGGVVFTTIQKFLPDQKGDTYPLLSDRRNIVVIADEAHRSQYDFIDGFARHMRDALPNASFIGFTGTPIEKDDRNTPAVFGGYIDRYDIQRAVEDGATVPIYYESRLARIKLNEKIKPIIDKEFEEIARESEERARKGRWQLLEKLVGAKERLDLVAQDLVEHFEKRQEVLVGKGMIVCMSRRIAVEMYEAITRIRPDWHSDDDSKGKIKVVMSGSAGDPPEWQRHIRNKPAREALARRFKDPGDELQLVIVRDMWLTGFDAPSLHTMYVDKPMSGHNLMQAIARVNRVFRDKPGGLVVDYIGIAHALRRALAVYAESGGRGEVALDQEEAVAVMKEKYETVVDLLHGFDYKRLLGVAGTARLEGLAEAADYILTLPDGKKRYLNAVTALSKAFALAVPHAEALAIRDEVGLFQEIRAILAKATQAEGGRSPEELDAAVQQLIAKAVSGVGVVDIFAAAGLKRPDISVLSEEFLNEVRRLPQKHLALETLRKLLTDEIKTNLRKNVVQARKFSEMLEEAMRRYHNRAIETAEVIEELIEIAHEIRAAEKRGEELGLSEEELAFYDALGANDSAVAVLGDATLRKIAQELVEAVRKSTTIDWTVRESARAKMRVIVKRILRRYGYPPDKQEKATQTVLEQAEALSEEWVAG